MIHAHLHKHPSLCPLIWHPGRRRGGPHPPIQPLLGTIMASYSGLAPVLRPLWRALNVPILTAHLILDPHQAAKHGAKDEMCRAGLCLPHIAASHISSRDEKGIVQCYISSSPTTLCKSFNVHRRPESSIPPIPISCLGCIWNIQSPGMFALTFEIANIFSYSVVRHDIC